jgi:peptidyl-prolyl cis-trans isomerase SurA
MKRALLVAALLALLPATVTAGTPFRIVAVVNNDIVSSYQLEEALHERQLDATSTAVPPDDLRRLVLDQLIEEQLLAQRAVEIGLSVDAAEVEAAITDVQKQNRIDRKQLEEALSRQGIDFEQYSENLRRQILRYKLLGREMQSRIEVTSREVRDYYQAHSDEYRQPQALRLSHISFLYPAEADATIRAAVRSSADATQTRLAAGFDFMKLLAELKEQQGAVGGDLGVVPEPEMNPAFVAAVKDLAPGTVSPVIETADGLHLLRLEERIAGQILPLEAAKEGITELLTEQKKKTAMQDWLAELKVKAHIEIRN